MAKQTQKKQRNKETKSKSKIGEPEKTDLLEEVSKWVICQSETGCCFHFLKKKRKKKMKKKIGIFEKLKLFQLLPFLFIYLFFILLTLLMETI